MKTRTARITPAWWLWWSPSAWRQAKCNEMVLNWWLSKPENENRIITELFNERPTQPSIKRGDNEPI